MATGSACHNYCRCLENLVKGKTLQTRAAPSSVKIFLNSIRTGERRTGVRGRKPEYQNQLDASAGPSGYVRRGSQKELRRWGPRISGLPCLVRLGRGQTVRYVQNLGGDGNRG